MTNTTGQPTLRVGAASYPPAYMAPSAQIERGYRAYITARVHGNDTQTARMVVRSAIRQAEAERHEAPLLDPYSFEAGAKRSAARMLNRQAGAR